MDILIHPTYFPSISHFVAITQADKITYEMEDNFQKQTNRNRMYIYSPNGVQLLNIPIKHAPNPHQKTKDVMIEYDFDWQKQHFKSLEAAYRSSPFFEYFEDELRPIFDKKHTFLMDLNLETIELSFKFLRLSKESFQTKEFFHEVINCTDLRHLTNGKKDTSSFALYSQVFKNKYGFLNNLSVLDLIFNEGKFAVDYLKEQKI
jgi:WbqC-like protein family